MFSVNIFIFVFSLNAFYITCDIAWYVDHVSIYYSELNIQYPKHSSFHFWVPWESVPAMWLIANSFLLQLRMCTTLGTFGRFFWRAGTRGAFAWFCFVSLNLAFSLYSLSPIFNLFWTLPRWTWAHEFPEGPLLADRCLKCFFMETCPWTPQRFKQLALKVMVDLAHSQSLVLKCFDACRMKVTRWERNIYHIPWFQPCQDRMTYLSFFNMFTPCLTQT